MLCISLNTFSGFGSVVSQPLSASHRILTGRHIIIFHRNPINIKENGLPFFRNLRKIRTIFFFLEGKSALEKNLNLIEIKPIATSYLLQLDAIVWVFIHNFNRRCGIDIISMFQQSSIFNGAFLLAFEAVSMELNANITCELVKNENFIQDYWENIFIENNKRELFFKRRKIKKKKEICDWIDGYRVAFWHHFSYLMKGRKNIFTIN